MVSTTPSLSSSESTTSARPSLSLSGASAVTATLANNVDASVSSAKSVTVTAPETTFATDVCIAFCADPTTCFAVSDTGSRAVSATTAFTIATEFATAAMVATSWTTVGVTSPVASVKIVWIVSFDIKSRLSWDCVSSKICLPTDSANANDTSVDSSSSSANVVAVCNNKPTC